MGLHNKVLCAFQDIVRDVWRIPIKVTSATDGNEYKLFIDPARVNYYTNDTLPDFFKERLALIAARNDAGWLSAEGIDFEKSTTTLNFVTFPPIQLDRDSLLDFGWRVNKNYYCVVTPSSIMVSLRGEPIVKESKSDDTRGKG
jgi:hypothetical protein